MTKKSWQKLKGLLRKQITQSFLEGESPTLKELLGPKSNSERSFYNILLLLIFLHTN